jgi:hypothetical protein
LKAVPEQGTRSSNSVTGRAALARSRLAHGECDTATSERGFLASGRAGPLICDRRTASAEGGVWRVFRHMRGKLDTHPSERGR